MKKCDFCVACAPDGKCPYVLQTLREIYCEKAIKLMVKALKGKDKK